MSGNFSVKWIDSGHEPRCKPNPKFPDGVDVGVAALDMHRSHCHTLLPYPTKRIGGYLIECNKCGLTAYVTTAGRIDDPRSFWVNCRKGEAK